MKKDQNIVTQIYKIKRRIKIVSQDKHHNFQVWCISIPQSSNIAIAKQRENRGIAAPPVWQCMLSTTSLIYFQLNMKLFWILCINSSLTKISKIYLACKSTFLDTGQKMFKSYSRHSKLLKVSVQKLHFKCIGFYLCSISYTCIWCTQI